MEWHEEALKMRDEGCSYGDIARTFNVQIGTVKKYCKHHGKGGFSHCNEINPIDDALNNAISGRYEYLHCYKDKTFKDWIYVLKCKKCGSEVKKSRGNMIHKGCIACPVCKRIESEKQKAKRLVEFEFEKQRKERERMYIFWSQDFEQITFESLFGTRKCDCCGAPYFITRNNQRYCSDKCAHRISERRKETNRRIRTQKQLIDKDITLEKLYKRDNGTCYLCGCECDWSDHEVINGNYVVGGKYPTIEHVYPLSKGGKHAWNNVRLACHGCNSRKGAKVLLPL